MEAPPSTGFSQAPGEYEYGGETQGATQQASQTFYANDVHPMDRPFFGCLQPCNSALRRIDFVKTRPIVRIGRGPNNDFNFPGMRISTKPVPPIPLLFCFLPPPTLCLCVTSVFFLGFKGLNHCQIKWDGCEDSRSNVTVHDNSTNGTWVRVFYSHHYPTFPLL
jgi:serine/threonine/tyrosine protein kinase RAD53